MERQKFCNTVEAKANLNHYLDNVAKGQEVVIRRRGKVIAKMVPATEESIDDQGQNERFMKKLRQFHSRVKKLHGKKSHTLSILRELRDQS